MASASKFPLYRLAWLCLVAALLLASISSASAGKSFPKASTKLKKKGMSKEGRMMSKTKKRTKEMSKGGHMMSKTKKRSKMNGASKQGPKSAKGAMKPKSSPKAHKNKMSKTSEKSPGKELSAAEVLEMAVDAIGGEDILMGLTSLELEATGETWVMFESEEPEELAETSSYERTYAIDLEKDRYRVDAVTTPRFEAFAFFPIQTFSKVINGNVGGMEGSYVFVQPGTLPSESVAASKRQQMLFNPHLLLQEAVKDPSIISSGGKSKDHHVLVVEDDITDILLYVNAKTGFVDKLETMEASPLIRDTKISVHYTGWDIESDGLLFPKTVELYGANGLLWTEERQFVEINMVDLIDESIFDLPPDTDPNSFDADRFEYGLQTHHNQDNFFEAGFLFPFNLGVGSPVEVATGLHLIPSDASNSVVIRHTNGVILLEAPGSEVHAMDLLNTIEDLFPGIDVTHLIQSHHHVDHASGVRQVLGSTDATLVVGRIFKEFWEDVVLHAESTIRPDSISENGYKGEVEGIARKSSKVLVDEDNLVVTVYHTDRDPHAKDNVFTAIEVDEEVYVYEADMYNGGFGLTVVVGGPEGFFDAMRDVGLISEDCSSDKPLSIIPAHGVVLTLEEAIAELTSLGVDVGCP